MLTLQPASRPAGAGGPRIGLALAGGGPLGLIYEIGALRALDQALEGIDLDHLDVYVGVSAGAVVAASLANGITPAQLCDIFVRDEAVTQAVNPETFLRPAFREYLSRAASVPWLLFDALREFIERPWELRFPESLANLSQAVPTGLFDNETIHEVLKQLYGVPGRSNDFRELERKLYVVAVDLDTAQAVQFGAKGHDHVPISRAVQASTALPGLYPPVEIDGHHYVDGALQKTLHASVALDEGVNLLICINPLVPFDAEHAAASAASRHERLVEGGASVVLSQTFRALIHSRMQVGMSKYQSQYQDADILLLEPNRDDPTMFFTNVFSFANRRQVAEHAYQATRKDLLAHRDRLGPVLARHGMGLRAAVLEEENRHFDTGLRFVAAAGTRAGSWNEITTDLSETLDRLTRWLRSSGS